MKTELLQLIRDTRMCLLHEFKKGELFEAGFLRPVPNAPQQPPVPTPAPAPRVHLAKPIIKTPAPEKKEEAPSQVPEIKKSKGAEVKESNEMLSFLKEKLPHLPLKDPPTAFIDLCFLYEAEEEALVQKIREALSKAKVQSTLVRASAGIDSTSSYKAYIATKKRIQESSHLHLLAGRRQDGLPHLAGTLLLIMPDAEALESPEVKRAFWNSLLQAAAS